MGRSSNNVEEDQLVSDECSSVWLVASPAGNGE